MGEALQLTRFQRAAERSPPPLEAFYLTNKDQFLAAARELLAY